MSPVVSSRGGVSFLFHPGGVSLVCASPLQVALCSGPLSLCAHPSGLVVLALVGHSAFLYVWQQSHVHSLLTL